MIPGAAHAGNDERRHCGVKLTVRPTTDIVSSVHCSGDESGWYESVSRSSSSKHARCESSSAAAAANQ